MQRTIAISKGSGHPKYERYEPWLKAIDPSIACVDLSLVSLEEACATLHQCDGLVCTGGPDIHPIRYERPDLLPLCGTLDEERDVREHALFSLAYSAGIPLLGICRGMQLMNVTLGGTLIADLPQERKTGALHQAGEEDATHSVVLAPGSILEELTGSSSALINSFHHQAVDRCGGNLQAIAWAEDGTTEAVISSDNTFLLAVQWHPERMDWQHPLSYGIGASFLSKTLQQTSEHGLSSLAFPMQTR